jgi:hypothetical protein
LVQHRLETRFKTQFQQGFLMSMFSNGFKFALAASATAALMACGGGSSTPDAYKIATADASVLVGTTNGASTTAAISGTTFSFPAGVAPLGTTAVTTIKLTSGTPDSFEAKTGASTASGPFSYGSCIFTVATSNDTALWPVGTVVTVPNCTYTIPTAGASANGTATPLNLALTLGTSKGTASVPVTVNVNGSVLVNGKPFGTAPIVVPTGAGG